MTLTKALKFSGLLFEKAEDGKNCKRPIVSGESDFCATPSFHVREQKFQGLANILRKSGKANLFCRAVNQTIACHHCVLKHHVPGNLS